MVLGNIVLAVAKALSIAAWLATLVWLWTAGEIWVLGLLVVVPTTMACVATRGWRTRALALVATAPFPLSIGLPSDRLLLWYVVALWTATVLTALAARLLVRRGVKWFLRTDRGRQFSRWRKTTDLGNMIAREPGELWLLPIILLFVAGYVARQLIRSRQPLCPPATEHGWMILPDGTQIEWERVNGVWSGWVVEAPQRQLELNFDVGVTRPRLQPT